MGLGDVLFMLFLLVRAGAERRAKEFDQHWVMLGFKSFCLVVFMKVGNF